MSYFRVLYSPRHYHGWNSAPVANSSHHQPPGSWIAKWQETHDRNDPDANYPLSCLNFGKIVKFTKRAQQRFLADPEKNFSQCLGSTEVYEVGELDGVCAFTTATECHNWVSANPKFKANPNDIDFVAFEGEYVCEVAEDKGVVAKVMVKKSGLLKLDEFKRLFLQ